LENLSEEQPRSGAHISNLIAENFSEGQQGGQTS